MNDLPNENPYESPTSDQIRDEVARTDRDRKTNPFDLPIDPTVKLTRGTFVPRMIAASVDQFAVFVLGIAGAKCCSDDMPALQVGVCIAIFTVYFVAAEAIFGRTPGKLLTGLKIVGVDLKSCNWRQAIIRTGFRVIEVNPILLGELPAAISIFFSPIHQRIGDKVAGTIVVHARGIGR